MGLKMFDVLFDEKLLVLVIISHSFKTWKHFFPWHKDLNPISKNIFPYCEGASCFPLRKVRRKCWSTDPLSTQGGFSLCQVSNTAKAKLYVSSKSSGFFFLIHRTPMPINRYDLTNSISGGYFFLIVLINKSDLEYY